MGGWASGGRSAFASQAPARRSCAPPAPSRTHAGDGCAQQQALEVRVHLLCSLCPDEWRGEHRAHAQRPVGGGVDVVRRGAAAYARSSMRAAPMGLMCGGWAAWGAQQAARGWTHWQVPGDARHQGRASAWWRAHAVQSGLWCTQSDVRARGTPCSLRSVATRMVATARSRLSHFSSLQT